MYKSCPLQIHFHIRTCAKYLKCVNQLFCVPFLGTLPTYWVKRTFICVDILYFCIWVNNKWNINKWIKVFILTYICTQVKNIVSLIIRLDPWWGVGGGDVGYDKKVSGTRSVSLQGPCLLKLPVKLVLDLYQFHANYFYDNLSLTIIEWTCRMLTAAKSRLVA